MFNLKEEILEKTKYVSGYLNQEDKYVISASMVAKEPLQNYLSIIHGNIENTEVDDTTLGSVFHLGLERLVTEDANTSVIGVEQNYSHELPNGWIFSGTADLVTFDIEDITHRIRDYKLTKSYAVTQFKKDPVSHQYTTQLNSLEYLAKKKWYHWKH